MAMARDGDKAVDGTNGTVSRKCLPYTNNQYHTYVRIRTRALPAAARVSDHLDVVSKDREVVDAVKAIRYVEGTGQVGEWRSQLHGNKGLWGARAQRRMDSSWLDGILHKRLPMAVAGSRGRPVACMPQTTGGGTRTSAVCVLHSRMDP
jgi:hypothetical protein